MSSAATSTHRDDRVAVVGGGIAGLAAAWELSRAGQAVTLLDAAPRFGGKIASQRLGGFLVESGPDSFVTRKPQAVELARELGLGDRLLETREENHRVRILHRGRLVDLPSDGGSALPCRLAPIWGSELLSWRGKLRLTLERWVPRRRADGDESLAAFLRRRFGREVLERFAGPVLAGIYLAEPETLSLRAAFPQFAEIEKRHGSVLKAMQASQGRGMPAPAAARVSLKGGVGELVAALVLEMETSERVELRTGAAVTSLARGASGWRLGMEAGAPVEAVAVVLAAPASIAAPLIEPHAPETAAILARIRYVSTAAVTLGCREADLPEPLDGFGFVVPAAEGRRITACTWSSAKFDDRAEPGTALLRAFLGGPRGEQWLEEGDEALVRVAREELADLMGLDGEPLVAVVHRHRQGTPQYEVGHQERIAAAEAALPAGLHLAGSAYHGIGIPDCIASGRRAAAAVR